MDKIRLTDFFTVEQLRVVESDINNHYNGKKNVYVVDTYDIINYTLPFINSDKLSSDSKFTLSTIFYENVFNVFEDIDLILADEYKVELSHIVDNLQDKIRMFPVIREKLLSSINDSLNQDEDNSKNKELLYENLELIIVLYIFIEKGRNLFQKFNDFIAKLSIDEFKSNSFNSNSCIEITETFTTTQPSDNINLIFEKFVDLNKYKIASLQSDYKRYCYLDNSYRDINVIDRVVNINNGLKNKFIVHYLSSTPKKTKSIFNAIENVQINDHHRNISQVYILQNILNKSESKEEAINSIQDLIELKVFDKSIEYSDNKVLKSLQSITDALKKEVTNSYIYNSYEYYLSIFKDLLSDDNSNSKESLLKIKKIITKINIDIPKDLLTDKLKSKLKLDQLQSLYDNLISQNIQINLGDDIIKNTFQHLPYLLFKDIKSNESINEFYFFLNKISDSSSLIGNSTELFKNDIKDILKNLSIKKLTFKGQNIDFIMLVYLNLIAETTEHHTNENKIISIIENKILLIENSKLTISKSKEQLSVEKSKNISYIDDLYYILIWLYRRVKNFKKCEEIFYRNNEFNDDYRFNHGLALSYHSLAYELIEVSKTEAIIKFKLSKKHLKKAYLLYDSVQVDNISYNQLLKKQQVAILNTLIDANLRMFEVEDKINILLLEESREFLSLIKNIIKIELSHIHYETLETINHTESELEYYEALNEYNGENYIDSILKLNHTTERLKIVLKSKVLIGKRFMKIETKVNELRYNNLVKLNLV